jgi:hypothetical protein
LSSFFFGCGPDRRLTQFIQNRRGSDVSDIGLLTCGVLAIRLSDFAGNAANTGRLAAASRGAD